MDVSHAYATLVTRGLKIPHPGHWVALAKLVEMSGSFPPKGCRVLKPTFPVTRTYQECSIEKEETFAFNVVSISIRAH